MGELFFYSIWNNKCGNTQCNILTKNIYITKYIENKYIYVCYFIGSPYTGNKYYDINTIHFVPRLCLWFCTWLVLFQMAAIVPDRHIKVHRSKNFTQITSACSSHLHSLSSINASLALLKKNCGWRAGNDSFMSSREKIHLRDLPRVRKITWAGKQCFECS